MRQVNYAGGSFITSDAVANALLEYAASLANADRAATVHAPAIGDNGEPVDIQILIGPASQLMAQAIEHEGTGPDGTEFAAGIAERMNVLRRTFIPFDGEPSIWGM